MTFLRSPKFYDRLEQIIAAGLYVWFVTRLWPEEFSGLEIIPVLVLISEGVVLLFILLRRSTDQISMNWKDWFIAAAGTVFALLVTPGGEPLFPTLCLILVVVGMLTHIGAKLSLQRSFGLVAANRGVKVSGMYVFVRHPMYAGYMMTHIGFFLFAPTLQNFAVYAATWTLLIMRVFAEERILSQDVTYREFQSRVPYRLLPGVF